MQAQDADLDIRARLDKVLPLIAQNASRHEQERRVSPEVYDALKKQGLFGLLAPKVLGGMEVSPTTAYAVWEEIARHDSATSWNLSQSNGGLMMCASLKPSGLEKVFIDGNVPVFAGAAFPQGRALRENGGYRVTGKIRFVSGCHGADWMFMPFIVDEAADAPSGANARPQVMMGLFPAVDAQIHHTWETMGMCGTGSHDVSVTDIFVPDALAVSLTEPNKPSEVFSGPLYRVSPWPVVHGEALAALGIASVAINRLIDLAGVKQPANTPNLLRDREAVQLVIGRARAYVESARSYLYQTTDAAYAEAHGADKLSDHTRQSLQLSACYITEASAKAIDLVYEAAGSSAFWISNPFERHFRDVHVITQHAQLAAPRYTSVGKMMLGLPADTPMLK